MPRQAGRRARLAFEATAGEVVVGERLSQELDGHAAIEGPVLSAPDGRHPALRNSPDRLISRRQDDPRKHADAPVGCRIHCPRLYPHGVISIKPAAGAAGEWTDVRRRRKGLVAAGFYTRRPCARSVMCAEEHPPSAIAEATRWWRQSGASIPTFSEFGSMIPAHRAAYMSALAA